MTNEEAMRIIDPETCLETVAEHEDEIESYDGIYKIFEDAFATAHDALRKQVPRQVVINYDSDSCECPSCGGLVGPRINIYAERNCDYFCGWCGQALLWKDENEAWEDSDES